MGEAALLSAKTGQDYLAFAKQQATTANQWAAEDRARYKRTFQPLEDRFIADAESYDSPEKQAAAADEARADVSLATAQAQEQGQRRAMALGVNPASGRFINASRKAATTGALAGAGAGNLARRQIRMMGEAKRADAVNLGKGMAVNPGTSLSLATAAGGQGFSGAMQGYGQQANILNQDHQNRMRAWEANQGALGGFGQAIGTVIGALPWSSKKLKENKKPTRNLAEAVKSLKIEEWNYKKGVADDRPHVGPYAEDFKAATGLGDGVTINPIDAVGVTMGAVKEIAEKVDRIERKIRMAA